MSRYVDAIELLRWERRIADMVATALREYLPIARDAVLPSLTADGIGPISPDAGALAATYEQWQQILAETMLPGVELLMAERILKLSREAGISVEDAAHELGLYVHNMTPAQEAIVARAYAIPTVRDWMETYLSDVENKMVQTPDSVFRQVASALEKGMSKGEGTDLLSDRVQDVLDFNGTLDWPRRAELVARTECLPPDAPINGANVTAVYRRPYSGPWVVVQTQAGHTVSGTPNHPVLTERGWVGLGDLRESDHLVRDLANVECAGASGNEHVDGGPATIGEIFDAVKAVAVPVRMRTGQPDFHGDGGHGDVEVLRPDRVLRLGSFASLDERVKQFGLEPADSGDATLGAGFRRTLPVDQGLSLFSGAEWDALVAETANDGVAVASVVGSEPVDRLASKVAGSNVGGGNVVAGAGVFAPSDAGGVVLGGSPNAPSEAADDTGHRGAVDAVVGGERGCALPGLIALDKVLSVEVTQYAGHVYNVTCEEGYFAGVGGIVTSNTTGAFNAATLEAARVQEKTLGVTLEKVWVCTIDGRTRDDHFAADGQRVPLDGTFLVGGHEMRYPGDKNAPVEQVANCVTGDALVAWPGQDVFKAFRRSHEGTFVNLRTARGHVLTVTPNHPVLTPAGYVAAGSLAVGDRVLATREPVTPDVQDGPASIEQTFRALSEGGVQERIIGDGVVFHGDVSDQCVDVVTADSSLRDRVETGGVKRVDEGSLAGLGGGESAGPGLGGRQGGLESVLPDSGQRLGASSGRVGSSSEAAALSGRHPLHAEPGGLGAAADGQVEFSEPPGDEGARDAEALRHLEDAHAVGMEPTQLIEVEMYTGRHDVYNLSTSGEWYSANGISVHNCRCTIVELEPDDPLPDESDRQTERGPTDSVVKHRDGSRQDEIDRRARDGVTRARDEDDGSLRASVIGANMKRNWTGRLVPIGEASGDRRIFKSGGEFSFRTFPLPLMHQRQTSGGHDESVTVGAIRSAEVREDGIYAEGVLFDTPEAHEAAAMLEEGVTRPSIDWCDESWELVGADGQPVDPETLTPENIDEVLYQVTSMTMMAATLVSKPAFDGTYVQLDSTAADSDDDETDDETDSETDSDTDDETDDEDAVALAASLLAAGGPGVPVFDAEAFADPQLTEVTGIHATSDGRVVGHVATWNQCHVGVGNACVVAPRSKTGYALFHVSEVDTTEGPVAVGRLTVGAGHADPKAGVVPAREHYDNAASCWALGRVYEDDHGIAFAGVVHPDATTRQIMDGTSAPLSGDWRRHGGNLELVAALTVNTPGFPVVRGAADERGRDLSLVAAGVVPVENDEGDAPLAHIVAAAAKAAVAEYADQQRREAKAAAVAGRVRERIDADARERVAAIAARREGVLS